MDLDVAALLREEYQRTLRLARERRAIQLDRQLAAAKLDPQVRLISTSHENHEGFHGACTWPFCSPKTQATSCLTPQQTTRLSDQPAAQCQNWFRKKQCLLRY